MSNFTISAGLPKDGEAGVGPLADVAKNLVALAQEEVGFRLQNALTLAVGGAAVEPLADICIKILSLKGRGTEGEICRVVKFQQVQLALVQWRK